MAAELEQEIRWNREHRVVVVSQLAAVIYAGRGHKHANSNDVREAIVAARALLVEAERTEP